MDKYNFYAMISEVTENVNVTWDFENESRERIIHHDDHGPWAITPKGFSVWIHILSREAMEAKRFCDKNGKLLYWEHPGSGRGGVKRSFFGFSDYESAYSFALLYKSSYADKDIHVTINGNDE